MPHKALKPCAHVNCPNLVEKGYCDEHRGQARRASNYHDPRSTRLYGRPWQKRRRAHLASHPWCEDCLERGIWTGATEVHHEVAHKGDVEIFWASPLRSLCKPCHSKRTFAEANGKPDGYYPTITQPLGVTVYLVCGAPASGKTTFVSRRAEPGDLVLDLDTIISEMTGHAPYQVESKATVQAAIHMRNARLELLQHHHDQGRAAWLIVSAPTARERYTWRTLLKPAAVYVLLTSEAECCRRIEADERRAAVMDDQQEAVERWWKKYQPLPDDQTIEGEGQ